MPAGQVPAWLRHAGIAYAAAAAGVVCHAVVDAQGVTGVDWVATLTTALDTGAYTTAGAMIILVSTPATRRYGTGRHRYRPGENT